MFSNNNSLNVPKTEITIHLLLDLIFVKAYSIAHLLRIPNIGTSSAQIAKDRLIRVTVFDNVYRNHFNERISPAVDEHLRRSYLA